MACFVVPAGEAIVSAVANKIVKNKEVVENHESTVEAGKIPFSRKLKWLTHMLTGGAVLLAFEHLWHGEITPFFPFLTATATKADTAVMLKEMATTGVTMAVFVTLVWAGMLAVVHVKEKHYQKELQTTER